MIEIACPKCAHVNYAVDREMLESCGYAPIKCQKCDEVYFTWANIDADSLTVEYNIRPKPIKVEIPPALVGNEVLIINKDHPRFGSLAVVVDKNHKRYRVKFDDGVILWLPAHWVSNDHCRDRCRNHGA